LAGAIPSGVELGRHIQFVLEQALRLVLIGLHKKLSVLRGSSEIILQ
jgi:hypothetical protein